MARLQALGAMTERPVRPRVLAVRGREPRTCEREHAARVVRRESGWECDFTRLSSCLRSSTLRRPQWVGVLGCASEVEENGYPMGIRSVVITLLSAALMRCGHCPGHCWPRCVGERTVGLCGGASSVHAPYRSSCAAS